MKNPDIKLNPYAAAAALCRKPGGFFYFVQEFWEVIIPETPVWNWHIEYLCNEAEELVQRLKRREVKKNDLIVNIPPGSSKSTIWSQMLPAYAWAMDDTLRILLVSYSDGAATTNCMKCRDIVQSDKYRAMFPHVTIRRDSNSKGEIQNTHNGQVYAAGISGTITGKHFHLILIDDPINPNEAASDIECAAASARLDRTILTRKVDKAVTVTALIMQRLSELDPTGHLLSKKGKQYHHICLPAEAIDGPKPGYLSLYYKGGLLDPVRMPMSVLDEAKTDLGTANYAAQFSMRPVPSGGLIWKKWFIEVPDESWPDIRHMSQLGTDWDTAFTKDEENAANAYVTAGKIGPRIYIDDIGWDWLETPELLKWIKTKQSPHYIEAKANGNPVRLLLVRSGILAIEVPVAGGKDKVARARMATPVAESGIVYIRKSIADKLYNDPRQGILTFPRGRFKDLADALAQCLQRLGRNAGVTSDAAVASGSDED